MPERERGIVTMWLQERAFGFIRTTGARRMKVFVHRTDVEQEGPTPRWPTLEIGELVEFEVVFDSGRGPAAKNVRRVHRGRGRTDAAAITEGARTMSHHQRGSE